MKPFQKLAAAIDVSAFYGHLEAEIADIAGSNGGDDDVLSIEMGTAVERNAFGRQKHRNNEDDGTSFVP